MVVNAAKHTPVSQPSSIFHLTYSSHRQNNFLEIIPHTILLLDEIPITFQIRRNVQLRCFGHCLLPLKDLLDLPLDCWLVHRQRRVDFVSFHMQIAVPVGLNYRLLRHDHPIRIKFVAETVLAILEHPTSAYSFLEKPVLSTPRFCARLYEILRFAHCRGRSCMCEIGTRCWQVLMAQSTGETSVSQSKGFSNLYILLSRAIREAPWLATSTQVTTV